MEADERAVKTVEKMMAAHEEKILSRMNAYEKSWDKDQKALQKQIDDQQKTICDLRQESANLKEHCATKIGNGGCANKIGSPEGVGSVGVLDTPPSLNFCASN